MKLIPLVLLSSVLYFGIGTYASDASRRSSPAESSSSTVKGILLVTSIQDLKEAVRKEVSGVEVYNLDIPGGVKSLNTVIGAEFIGKPLTNITLPALKKEILNYWRTHDRPVIAVDIPAQRVSDGVIRVVVTEATMGELLFKGNRYFKTKTLKKYIHISPGEPIEETELLDDIAFMNRNPFRHVDAFFTPGKKTGTTDIEVVTADRWPFRFYLGSDNTGNPTTGQVRYFGGFNWGNVFDLDHTFTYQGTVSGDFHKFIAHTVNYIAPLPWKHQIMVYGGYSEVKPKIHRFHSRGRSTQVSFRYEIPFKGMANGTLKNTTWGFDYKSMNNSLVFDDIISFPFVQGKADFIQFYGAFDLGYDSRRQHLTFSLQGFWAPCNITPHQTNHDFSQVNPYAKSKYAYLRAYFADDIRFGKGFVFKTNFRGQISDQNLLPSEQFALGGYDTVRGYDERIVNTDNAVCANVEIHTRPINLISMGGHQKYKDQLSLLAFFDYGWGKSRNSGFITNGPTQLMGVGPGLRYLINPYFSARLDWGFRLRRIPFQDSLGNKLHFGVVASY